jgi:hypothetical protein
MVGLTQKGLAGCLAWEARTPDLLLMPSSSLRPQPRATRRTTDTERWMSRLSQTILRQITRRSWGHGLEIGGADTHRESSCVIQQQPTKRNQCMHGSCYR